MYTKLVSSLEKVFHDQKLDDFTKIDKGSMLKNEIFSFQLIYQLKDFTRDRRHLTLNIDSPLKEFIKVFKVKEIPTNYPVNIGINDSYYLRREPGLYPDLLKPFQKNEQLIAYPQLNSIWFELNPDGQAEAGNYPIKITVTENDEVVTEDTFTVEIIDAMLDKDEFTMTQWFYLDCLMNYYETEAFSEKHWLAIENFMANARKYGQNMILTPVLSPELDTMPGIYRNPAQLAQITVNNGEYSFNFDRLGKWVDLCDKIGIKYLEINHFFTQWGGAHCPQVWATVDGEYKRIFGWDNDSGCDEYKDFLAKLIPALLKYLKDEKNGADRRCKFHISDEPQPEHFETYKKLYDTVKPLIGDLPTIDAISSYELYEKGLIDCPVPNEETVEEFVEHGVKGVWTYYCCGPVNNYYSNRFFSMPSARTRIIGMLFWKFGIIGFLHWGYNFYNSFLSRWTVNPFIVSDGDGFAPSGDMFIVYPGDNYTPWPSLRALVFNEALQDRAALALCEKLVGHEKTMKLLNEDDADPITFRNYPHGNDYILELRRKVNETIKNNIDNKAD